MSFGSALLTSGRTAGRSTARSIHSELTHLHLNPTFRRGRIDSVSSLPPPVTPRVVRLGPGMMANKARYWR
jgi:hypothetical protein